METAIRTDEGWLSFEAPTLEVARLIASATGFNVDVEPGAPGHVTLTATMNTPKGVITITKRGSTVNDAAAAFIKEFVHE